MSNQKILIIEDDVQISDMLKSYLESEAFIIDVAANGEAGLEAFNNKQYDLVLLDLMLPLKSGFDVMQIIRKTSQIPILIISARDQDIDKAIGLGLGADDYIAKPFSLIEVVARIKAHLRRSMQFNLSNDSEENTEIHIQNLVINPINYTVKKDGTTIKLTNKEFHILHLLASHPKQVFTKVQIYSQVWSETYYGDENVINVHMRRLREKIEDDASNPKVITTLWGIGYRIGE